MGLTSHKVLAMAIVVAVALMVATVWWWPRLARRDVLSVLGRIGLLLVTQLGLLCVLALAANDYFAFYSSWADLLGTGGPSSVTVQNRAGKPGDPPTTSAPAARVTVLGTEPLPASAAGNREPKAAGQIQAVRFGGPSTGLTTDGYVYLPPQYFQPAYAERTFPAVIVMTGFPGDARNLVTRLNYPGFSLGLNLAGKEQPTVLVLMRPSPAMPRDPECEDVPGGPQSETYFVKDVPAMITGSYRVAADPHRWAVMGDSTGGYCALKLVMRHPEAFTSAVSLSGYYKAAEDVTTGDLFGGSRQRRDEADLDWRLRNLPPPPVAVLLAGSQSGDGDYLKQTDAFLAEVKPPMTAATATVPSGGHNFQTWNQLIPPALQWISDHMPPAG